MLDLANGIFVIGILSALVCNAMEQDASCKQSVPPAFSAPQSTPFLVLQARYNEHKKAGRTVQFLRLSPHDIVASAGSGNNESVVLFHDTSNNSYIGYGKYGLPLHDASWSTDSKYLLVAHGYNYDLTPLSYRRLLERSEQFSLQPLGSSYRSPDGHNHYVVSSYRKEKKEQVPVGVVASSNSGNERRGVSWIYDKEKNVTMKVEQMSFLNPQLIAAFIPELKEVRFCEYNPCFAGKKGCVIQVKKQTLSRVSAADLRSQFPVIGMGSGQIRILDNNGLSLKLWRAFNDHQIDLITSSEASIAASHGTEIAIISRATGQKKTVIVNPEEAKISKLKFIPARSALVYAAGRAVHCVSEDGRALQRIGFDNPIVDMVLNSRNELCVAHDGFIEQWGAPDQKKNEK